MFAFCKYFFAKNQEKTCFLQRKTGLRPGNTARFRFYVYQKDVGAYFADAIPGNYKVFPLSSKGEKTAFSRYYDGADIACRQFNDSVGNVAQPPPVANADDFFAGQVRITM